MWVWGVLPSWNFSIFCSSFSKKICRVNTKRGSSLSWFCLCAWQLVRLDIHVKMALFLEGWHTERVLWNKKQYRTNVKHLMNYWYIAVIGHVGGTKTYKALLKPGYHSNAWSQSLCDLGVSFNWSTSIPIEFLDACLKVGNMHSVVSPPSSHVRVVKNYICPSLGYHYLVMAMQVCFAFCACILNVRWSMHVLASS